LTRSIGNDPFLTARVRLCPNQDGVEFDTGTQLQGPGRVVSK